MEQCARRDDFHSGVCSMALSGELFLGSRPVARAETFFGVNPATGERLDPPFSVATQADVDAACELAWSAFDTYRQFGAEARAQFLEAIAEQILALGDELIERAHLETGLPLARLTGERGRTVGQLRLFAEELRKGYWLGLRIDPAMPDRKPAPRSDLRLRNIPLGPVAVFGASNFPLAFSVAGGDTAAALAAGCPIVVKGHPAHPGTGELVARAIVKAVEQCALPAGVFSLLNGASNDLGAQLVAHPRIKAVGFTGSRAGGVALMKIAAARPEPIPVYAEMSSINPVIVLPGALQSRTEALAKEFAASLTLGVGQFCTNPGILIGLDSPDLRQFVAAAAAALRETQPGVMLTAGIHGAYERGVDELSRHPHLTSIARGPQAQGKYCGSAALFGTTAADLIRDPEIAHEVFGPASLVVYAQSEQELMEVLERLEGQLTATLHVTEQDTALAGKLLPILERKAGRILANGWPTGVEVTHAMVHGGPYPATSDGRTTSVGTLAIERFLRPVCYQDLPEALLPAELRNNGVGNPRRFDGDFVAGSTD
jgi:alpha-ketoglutaric semialdehyde dehydrogenase